MSMLGKDVTGDFADAALGSQLSVQAAGTQSSHFLLWSLIDWDKLLSKHRGIYSASGRNDLNICPMVVLWVISMLSVSHWHEGYFRK